MVSVSRRSLLAVGAALPLLGRLDWAVASPKPGKADKGLKHPLALLGGDSRAVILNQQRCARTLQRQADRHPLAAVAQGVIDQIIQHTHFIALGQQCFNEMRANKTRTAGDQNSSIKH